ncbi:MAG: LacI family DNA-binding transcriptional regulator [Eubacteriales bacterium]|nr:LacI family DNA-binding transcriptional regulator [Eubacteriales bacterium]
MGGKPTLKDIAGKLQVSTVTVSNALAGRSGVGEELRSRIIQEARAIGYQRGKRKEKASSAKKRTLVGMKIGVITEERYLEKFTSFYWELYQKIVIEASQNGNFVLLEVLTEEMRRFGELPKLVQQSQVDALIVLGRMSTPYLHKLHDLFMEPMVLMDFDDVEISCDSVISNGFYGMYYMTNYLIHAGHTKLGFVGSYLATDSIMDRYQGFTKSLLEHGLLEREEWILDDRDTDTGKTFVNLPKEMPTAFVCNCDLTVNLMAEELRKAGYRIPEDISLVGFDDFLAEGDMKGKITTYSVDMEAMAHYGLKLLMKRKKGELDEKIVRIVEGRLIERSSAAKYPFCG